MNYCKNIVEYHKISKFLDNTAIQSFKFRIKKWTKVSDDAHETDNMNHIQNCNVKIKFI